MAFKDFNNIIICNEKGVSPADDASKLIVRNIRKLKFKSVLDVGTGTGFMAIYLKTLGYDCEGTDINPKAIECARKNAERNKVKINFYISDLFENVNHRFDLIVFNLPYGNTRSIFLSRYLEMMKSFLPKKNAAVLKFSFLLVRKQRRALIKRFLKDFKRCLKKNGRAVILIHSSELPLIKGISFTVIEGYRDLSLILLKIVNS